MKPIFNYDIVCMTIKHIYPHILITIMHPDFLFFVLLSFLLFTVVLLIGLHYCKIKKKTYIYKFKCMFFCA